MEECCITIYQISENVGVSLGSVQTTQLLDNQLLAASPQQHTTHLHNPLILFSIFDNIIMETSLLSWLSYKFMFFPRFESAAQGTGFEARKDIINNET